MKRGIIRLHRALSLVLLAFWALQGSTGTLLAFRWEIEDALLPGPAAAADPEALGARIESIVRDGGRPAVVWSSAASATRFDIFYADSAGTERVLRVDGHGRVLRDGLDGERFANGGVWDTFTLIHTELLAGEAGSWIIAASGLLLVANVIIGLRLAWPRVGSWRRVLLGETAGPRAARLHAWHRRIGLWLGLIVLPFFAAGVLLCFEHGLRELTDQEVSEPPASEKSASRISVSQALEIAASHHPGSRFSMLGMPSARAPWFRIRQLRPHDMARNWGTSTLFVSAVDGRVLADHPSRAAPAGRKLIDFLYPFHTGQVAGIAGRTLVLLQGIWLVAMVILGFSLWRVRRSRSRDGNTWGDW